MTTFYCAGLIIQGDEDKWWTNRWSDNPNHKKPVVGCVTRDGKEHSFKEPMSVVEARKYQTANGGYWIGKKELV